MLSKAIIRSFYKPFKYNLIPRQVRNFRSDFVGISGFNRFVLYKDQYYEDRVKEYSNPKKPSVTVAVTGGAGQIGYSLLFRIASGQMFGPDQPVYLNIIELPNSLKAAEGVKMELLDCAFPLLKGVDCTASYEKGFEEVDYALLVGSKPRGKNQERSDLLKENGQIFKKIGIHLNKAKPFCKVLVVGNPANTNTLICASHAKNIDPKNFTCMMRLDHDRAISLASRKLGNDAQFITEFCVWGNHSSTMFPDLTNTKIYGEIYRETFGNIEFDEWNENEFIPQVQNRGAEIIKYRGHSSAASAANAAVNHMRDWVHGTGNKSHWVSMGVYSEGDYGIPKGLWSGFPVDCVPKENYKIIKDLPLSLFQTKMIKKTIDEMVKERDMVRELIKL